ncbi:hypothetical protein PENTCL1PPCAC_1887 [Pristionchus entomophagus]|uniref:Acyltransferase n=1 Tax=Pristionchus entomophagus TaxID=358040 RepID=A0AAV5SB96_9BILA|nr:hypothetical protein PENTCL1PPCAC_1887 [Pristionchus entomophagus]
MAPWNTTLKLRLQEFAVFHHIMANSMCNIVAVLILIYLYKFGLAHLVYLYFAWMWWDLDSPYNGGYSSRYFLNLRMHTWFCQYFPLKLHTLSDLTDDQNYLIVMHPHGILGASSYHFMSNGSGLMNKFPKINFHACTLNFKFWTPLCREWLMLHGVISCSREAINNVLSDPRKGQAALLVVGGAQEALDAHPGQHVLTLKKRKGFIKAALENGASLVPCFAFGENDVFHQVSNEEGSIVRWVQTLVKNICGVSPVLFYGGFGPFMPFRTPLNTVLGAPISVTKIQNPTHEQIDQLQTLYIERLTELYGENKEKYGIDSDNNLIIR